MESDLDGIEEMSPGKGAWLGQLPGRPGLAAGLQGTEPWGCLPTVVVLWSSKRQVGEVVIWLERG